MNSQLTGIDGTLAGFRSALRNDSVLSDSTSLKKRNQELFFNKVNSKATLPKTNEED